MTIDSLKMFRDLADTQSFTRTAEINEVTQSAVSQQISAMERLFKATLIQRGKRHFQLTPQGELFYEHSKQMLQTFAELQDTLNRTRELVSGKIRISTVYSIGLHELPPYLKKFLQEYPSATLQVEYRRANQVYEDVLSNVVDLGLVAYPSNHRELEILPLRKDPLVLICHPQHPLATRRSVKLKALNGLKFVGFERDIPTRRALDRLFKASGVSVDYVMEFDNVETVKQAVEIDSGVSIVPETVISQELAKGTLVAVQLDGGYARPLAVIHTKVKTLSPAMKQFIAVLKTSL